MGATCNPIPWPAIDLASNYRSDVAPFGFAQGTLLTELLHVTEAHRHFDPTGLKTYRPHRDAVQESLTEKFPLLPMDRDFRFAPTPLR